MHIDLAQAANEQACNFLIGLIVPIPIAKVTNMNVAGQLSAAFSKFYYVNI